MFLSWQNSIFQITDSCYKWTYFKLLFFSGVYSRLLNSNLWSQLLLKTIVYLCNTKVASILLSDFSNLVFLSLSNYGVKWNTNYVEKSSPMSKEEGKNIYRTNLWFGNWVKLWTTKYFIHYRWVHEIGNFILLAAGICSRVLYYNESFCLSLPILMEFWCCFRFVPN